jgi:phenylacetate-CoA ligase
MSAVPTASADLEPIERASRDELQALQLERLRRTLQHAYENVAHYRRAFDAKGVHPGDLRTLADLAKFPFTVKSDFRDNYPFGLLAVPREQCVRLHASSGTTGKPTVVGYTAGDIDNWAHLVARSIRAAGGRAGDIVHVAYGYGLFTGGLGAHYGAERLGCTVIPMSGGQTEKQVQLIRDLKPDIIMVTPSYMQVLIEEFVRLGLDARDCSLRVGIFGAEPWTEAMRREIETNAGIDAVDIYGLSEVMGPGVASECVETKDGPVIWEGPLLPGDHRPGHRRGAARRRGGRARLHDLDEGSAAGDPLPHARPDAPLAADRAQHAADGQDRRPQRRHADHSRRQSVPTQVEEIVLSHGQLSGQYQLVVTRQGNLDEVQVRCEMLPAHATANREEVAAWVRGRIKTMVGISCAVDVAPPDSIERTLVGKARRVIDQRKK